MIAKQSWIIVIFAIFWLSGMTDCLLIVLGILVSIHWFWSPAPTRQWQSPLVTLTPGGPCLVWAVSGVTSVVAPVWPCPWRPHGPTQHTQTAHSLVTTGPQCEQAVWTWITHTDTEQSQQTWADCSARAGARGLMRRSGGRRACSRTGCRRGTPTPGAGSPPTTSWTSNRWICHLCTAVVN